MEALAGTLAEYVVMTIRQVLELFIESAAGFWAEKVLKTRRALGVSQRLQRAIARIEALQARFAAGTLAAWRPRAVRERTAPPAADAPADCAASAGVIPPSRRRPYALPSHYGWLCEITPTTPVYFGMDLIATMQAPSMQALMRMTPAVFLIMLPVFRMYGLDDAVLLVPEGYVRPVVARRPYVPRRLRPRPPVEEGDEPEVRYVKPADFAQRRGGRYKMQMRQKGWFWEDYEDYSAFAEACRKARERSAG